MKVGCSGDGQGKVHSFIQDFYWNSVSEIVSIINNLVNEKKNRSTSIGTGNHMQVEPSCLPYQS